MLDNTNSMMQLNCSRSAGEGRIGAMLVQEWRRYA
jgi:hypothetical protein